ncbi:MAG: hypothetical protein V3R84_05645 [Acidimicrobiia bacterium]
MWTERSTGGGKGARAGSGAGGGVVVVVVVVVVGAVVVEVVSLQAARITTPARTAITAKDFTLSATSPP